MSQNQSSSNSERDTDQVKQTTDTSATETQVEQVSPIERVESKLKLYISVPKFQVVLKSFM